MKKWIVLSLLGFTILAQAQPTMELGNQLYEQKDYTGAAKIYEALLASGKESAALHFNLGNCYYQLHQTAPAIYSFEKAQLLDPSDEAIATNLNFAQKRSLDTIPNLPKVGFEKMVATVTETFHYDTWAWLSIVFSVVLVVFFVGYYFTPVTQRKRIYFSLMGMAFIALIISLFAGFFEQNYLRNERPAIVFTEKTPVHVEPTYQSTTHLKLREGAKVYILESSGSWLKVSLTDESTGWITAASVKELNP